MELNMGCFDFGFLIFEKLEFKIQKSLSCEGYKTCITSLSN